jgi:hypothetical protein
VTHDFNKCISYDKILTFHQQKEKKNEKEKVNIKAYETFCILM